MILNLYYYGGVGVVAGCTVGTRTAECPAVSPSVAFFHRGLSTFLSSTWKEEFRLGIRIREAYWFSIWSVRSERKVSNVEYLSCAAIQRIWSSKINLELTIGPTVVYLAEMKSDFGSCLSGETSRSWSMAANLGRPKPGEWIADYSSENHTWTPKHSVLNSPNLPGTGTTKIIWLLSTTKKRWFRKPSGPTTWHARRSLFAASGEIQPILVSVI